MEIIPGGASCPPKRTSFPGPEDEHRHHERAQEDRAARVGDERPRGPDPGTEGGRQGAAAGKESRLQAVRAPVLP